MVVSAFSCFQYREISAFCQVEDCATHLFSQKTTSSLSQICVKSKLFKFCSSFFQKRRYNRASGSGASAEGEITMWTELDFLDLLQRLRSPVLDEILCFISKLRQCGGIWSPSVPRCLPARKRDGAVWRWGLP